MKNDQKLKYYSPKEEQLNVYSHGLGLILSIICLFFLLGKASKTEIPFALESFLIFGVSMILLYAASTYYHRAKEPSIRSKLKIFDHAAIYILIAGTYTPFALITLIDSVGWNVFIVIWSMAVAGIILKLFFTGRFQFISTLLYVFMGWVIIFALNPLLESLSYDGILWLFTGGAFYTLGAIVYMIKKIPFNHALFHVFVLLGSGSHFISIYFYIL
jgi:hemolysin III